MLTGRAVSTALAALGLLAVLITALIVRADPASPPFQAVDEAWLRGMAGTDGGALWTIANAFDRIGARPGAYAIVLVAAVLVAVRRPASAIYATAAVAATYAVVFGLKALADRPRPEGGMVEVASSAFPSGHSARMAAFVIVLTAVVVPAAARRWWWPVAVLLVPAMMWARTWQQAHWLTDTFAGAVVGTGVSLLCLAAFEPMLRRERTRGRSARVARNGEMPTAGSD